MADLADILAHGYVPERPVELETAEPYAALVASVLDPTVSDAASQLPTAEDLLEHFAGLVARCDALLAALPTGSGLTTVLADGAVVPLPTADEAWQLSRGTPTLDDVDRLDAFYARHLAEDPDVVLTLPVRRLRAAADEAASSPVLASLRDSASTNLLDPTVRLREYFAVKLTLYDRVAGAAESASRDATSAYPEELSLGNALGALCDAATTPLLTMLREREVPADGVSAAIARWVPADIDVYSLIEEIRRARTQAARLRTLLLMLQVTRVRELKTWLHDAQGALEDAAARQLSTLRVKVVTQLFAQVISPYLQTMNTQLTSDIPVINELMDELATYAATHIERLQQGLAGAADQDRREAQHLERQLAGLFDVKLGDKRVKLLDKIIHELDTFLAGSGSLGRLLGRLQAPVWPPVAVSVSAGQAATERVSI